MAADADFLLTMPTVANVCELVMLFVNYYQAGFCYAVARHKFWYFVVDNMFSDVLDSRNSDEPVESRITASYTRL